MNETPSSSDETILTITTPTGAGTESLTKAETWALAHFVDRLSWSELLAYAADNDEAFLIKQAFDKLQDVLTRSGYATS